ncbi:MAG: tyrosine-type recombinase/integrase [Lachnospiraceae bacterium]|nr:tyrosine-type recombinase/integrase [Lachnospiraceae bacterium]
MAQKLPEIKQRKDGYFEVKITVAPNVRKSVYGATKADVRKKARELREEAVRFDISNIRKMTVSSYMTNWLTEVKKPGLKPGSYDRIEQSLQYQIFPHIGHIKINALTANDVQKMLNAILSEKSYSTVKKAYNNLNACMELGVQRGEILKNPVKGVKLPSSKTKEKKEITAYSPEEIKAITEEAVRTYSNGVPVYRYGYLIILILNTGMREGEPLYLKWKDVDLEKRRIYIHGNVTEVKNRDGAAESKYIAIEQETPKTDKSNRYIPLNDNALEALVKLRTIIRDEKRVIATKNHTILSPRKVYRTMENILARCNITDKTNLVHALRHTFATTLIRNGVDIKAVSEILGHEDVSTTLKIYHHTIDEQKQSAVMTLNNFY